MSSRTPTATIEVQPHLVGRVVFGKGHSIRKERTERLGVTFWVEAAQRGTWSTVKIYGPANATAQAKREIQDAVEIEQGASEYRNEKRLEKYQRSKNYRIEQNLYKDNTGVVESNANFSASANAFDSLGDEVAIQEALNPTPKTKTKKTENSIAATAPKKKRNRGVKVDASVLFNEKKSFGRIGQLKHDRWSRRKEYEGLKEDCEYYRVYEDGMTTKQMREKLEDRALPAEEYHKHAENNSDNSTTGWWDKLEEDNYVPQAV
jgi:hypothetical protein